LNVEDCDVEFKVVLLGLQVMPSVHSRIKGSSKHSSMRKLLLCRSSVAMFNGPGLDLSPTGRNPFLFTNISGVVLEHGGLPESLSTSTSEDLFDPGVLEAGV
jgi:hypothetical protein